MTMQTCGSGIPLQNAAGRVVVVSVVAVMVVAVTNVLVTVAVVVVVAVTDVTVVVVDVQLLHNPGHIYPVTSSAQSATRSHPQ
jgi:hypothetical protein